jgi:hypothetical protein
MREIANKLLNLTSATINKKRNGEMVMKVRRKVHTMWKKAVNALERKGAYRKIRWK